MMSLFLLFTDNWKMDKDMLLMRMELNPRTLVLTKAICYRISMVTIYSISDMWIMLLMIYPEIPKNSLRPQMWGLITTFDITASAIIQSVRIFFKLTKETNSSKERENESWPLSCMKHIPIRRKRDKKEILFNPWIGRSKRPACYCYQWYLWRVLPNAEDRGIMNVVGVGRAIFTSLKPKLGPKSSWCMYLRNSYIRTYVSTFIACRARSSQ